MANVLLRVSALLAAAFALTFLYMRLPESGTRDESVACERCNVVLISFDTVRADHLGAYGYGRPTSPNVDALAAKSLVFDRAISQAPWTLPAHGSMLSGLYPSRLGVLRYPATRTLPDKNTVLPEVFRAAGYATAGFTGGGFVSDHYGFDRGFDVYENLGRRFEHNLDATIEWVDKHKREPFFLFVHGYDAHRPYYSKDLDKKALGLPAGVAADQSHFCLGEDRAEPDAAGLEKIVRYYDASIHHGDRAIGVLLKALEQLHLMDNTVILLTSDHGEEFFEHGNCDHVRFLYEETVHVPYVLYVPRLVPDARRIGGLVPASISVARTLLDAVGIEHDMPGVTLLPVLRGEQKDFPIVYSEGDSVAGSLRSRGRTNAMTKGDLKLITYPEEGTEEAYDLGQDPGELHRLPEGDVAYLMRKALGAWAAALLPALPRPEPRGEMRDDDDAAGTGGEEKVAGAEGAPEPGSGAGSGSRSGSGTGSGAKDDARDGGTKVPKEVEEDLKSLGYLE